MENDSKVFGNENESNSGSLEDILQLSNRSHSARDRFKMCCRPYRIRRLKNKGALLILIWNHLVLSVFHYLILNPIMCFSKSNIPESDELNRQMDNFSQHECLWNDKCDYLQPEYCSNINDNGYNLLILQLNIRGMLSHQDDLQLLLHTLNKNRSSIDVVLLCETFLNSKTTKFINIPGYNLIVNNRLHAKGGGTAILIKKDIKYNTCKDLDIFIEKKVESVFVEILTKSNKHMVVGSMYRPPNSTEDIFLESILGIKHKLSKERERKELIIGMDHNYDLLKSSEHKRTQHFLNSLLDKELFPTITRPTRITHQSATLIDNIFVSANLHKKYDSAILINDMSDHLPILTML